MIGTVVNLPRLKIKSNKLTINFYFGYNSFLKNIYLFLSSNFRANHELKECNDKNDHEYIDTLAQSR